MAATSVLDRRRVAALLAHLTAPGGRAVAGLALLARAAGGIAAQPPRPGRPFPMKIISLLAAILTGIVLLIALVGTLLPRVHRVTRTAVYRRSPAEVFGVIVNFAAMPSWRSGLDGVEILPPE